MLEIVTPPALGKLITLPEAKTFLRLDTSDEDTLVGSLLAAAHDYLEGYLGRSLGTQVLRATLPYRNPLPLPRPPVISITLVRAKQGTTWYEVSTYVLEGDTLVFTQYPGHTVEVTYQAGYATLPAPLKQALLLVASHLYEHRAEDASSLPPAVHALCSPYRVMRL